MVEAVTRVAEGPEIVVRREEGPNGVDAEEGTPPVWAEMVVYEATGGLKR